MTTRCIHSEYLFGLEIASKQKWHCFSSIPFSDSIPNRWIMAVGKITPGEGKAPTVPIFGYRWFMCAAKYEKGDKGGMTNTKSY